MVILRFSVVDSSDNHDTAILSDSLSLTIMVSSKIVRKCLWKLSELGQNIKATLFWRPGHRKKKFCLKKMVEFSLQDQNTSAASDKLA